MVVLLAGACREGNDSAATSAEAIETVVPETIQDEPSHAPPAETSAPTAAPSPDALLADLDDDPATITVWYPRKPQSLDDFSITFPVERRIELGPDTNHEQRMQAIAAEWAAGPTDAELAAGYVHPIFDLRPFPDCSNPIAIEFVGDAAIASPCGYWTSDGVGADAFLLASFNATMMGAGQTRVAMLDTERRRCVGNESDTPLSCLPESATSDTTGNPCPVGRARIEATVSEVTEWARIRDAASLNGDELGQAALGQVMSLYPWTLRSDGSDFSWVVVELPDTPRRCGWMAAHLLSVRGTPLDTPIPGVDHTLPTEGIWNADRSNGRLDYASWQLDRTFATVLNLRVEHRTIEELTTQRFDATGSPWIDGEEIEVVGADLAVRPAYSVSDSGDGGVNEVWIQVGQLTVIGETYLYIEDLPDAPLEAMDAWIDSIAIDRELFEAVYGS